MIFMYLIVGSKKRVLMDSSDSSDSSDSLSDSESDSFTKSGKSKKKKIKKKTTSFGKRGNVCNIILGTPVLKAHSLSDLR